MYACISGLSTINKDTLLLGSPDTDTVELDTLCEHTSSFYSVQRQLSKSMILVSGLGRLPASKSTSKLEKTSGSKKKNKQLPGPGPLPLDTDLLFCCGSSVTRRKLQMGPRQIEKFSISWLTVCMHRHCPPSILLLLQELQAVMREFISFKTTDNLKKTAPFRKGNFYDDDDLHGVRKETRTRGAIVRMLSLKDQPEKQHVLLNYFFTDSKSSKKKSTHHLASKPITPKKFAEKVVKVCGKLAIPSKESTISQFSSLRCRCSI